MLAEERLAVILETVQQKRSVKVSELCNLLNASVSTVRRDISTLAEMGKLIKVHGGAIALSENFAAVEKDMEEKAHLFLKEKQAVAQYAASLLEDGDFVFLDAGTTTENMIGFLPKKDICFVTNGLFHAKKLAQRGFQVYIPGGEIKYSTEAIVGAECACTVARYHFTKSFLGTNGVSVSAGDEVNFLDGSRNGSVNRGGNKSARFGDELANADSVPDFDNGLCRCADVHIHGEHYCFRYGHTHCRKLFGVLVVRNVYSADAENRHG